MSETNEAYMVATSTYILLLWLNLLVRSLKAIFSSSPTNEEVPSGGVVVLFSPKNSLIPVVLQEFSTHH